MHGQTQPPSRGPITTSNLSKGVWKPQGTKLELDIEDGRNLQKSNADRKETLGRELDETRAVLVVYLT